MIFPSTARSAEKLQEVMVILKDQHHPRGARVVPLVGRCVAPAQPVQGRAPRRLELRQGDFDPAMRKPRLDRALREVHQGQTLQMAAGELGDALRCVSPAHRGGPGCHREGAGEGYAAVAGVAGEGEMMVPVSDPPTSTSCVRDGCTDGLQCSRRRMTKPRRDRLTQRL